MNKIYRLMTYGAIAAFALTGCGASSGANAPAPNTQVSVATNVLQFAVGTVNLFGTTNGGLNVVATYRQPSGGFAPGDSGTLVNSPTITLPGAIVAGAAAPAATVEGFDACSTAAFGAGANEVGTTAMTSTSQTLGQGTTAATTFGQSGGVFGVGIEPFNSTGQGDCTPPAVSGTGTPFQVAPYPVPIWDPTGAGCATAPTCDPNQMDAAWGGPPAVVLSGSGGDSVVGSGNYPGGTAGISLGIDVFQMPAPASAAGTYKLSVSVPANTGTVTSSSSFTLAAVNDLGTAGAAPGIVEDGTGGGTITLVPPAGPAAWTEALVEVTDYGTAAAGPVVWYTMEAVNGGNGVGCTALVCTLPDTIGPGATASIAASGTDEVVTQVVWVNYPLYEMQYGTQATNSGGKSSPTILGAAGSTDMSLSTRTCTMVAAADCNASLPLLHLRRARGTSIHRTNTTIKH